MKICFLICLLGILPSLVRAQSSVETKNIASLRWIGPTWSYLGRDSWSVVTSAGLPDTATYSFDWAERDRVRFGLAYRVQRANGWFAEWALIGLNWRVQEGGARFRVSDPSTGAPAGGERITRAGLRLRYQYGVQFGGESRRLVPALALGFDPFVDYLRVEPRTSAFFPAERWQAGGVLQVLPRLRYRLAERWDLWGEAPAPIATLYWQRTVVENPVLGEAERIDSKANAEVGIEGVYVRVGLGWRL